MNERRNVARWETKGGKRYLQLQVAADGCYSYSGDNCGGVICQFRNDDAAIAYMERNAVAVLKSDFPSTRRTY